MARTFLFSLKRPDLEIFKLRRLLPDFSPHNLSGLGGSPAPARTLGCWFSRELLVHSGLGGLASPGAGWVRGCAPTVASLLFFLLLVSDFHQGPELLVLLLSAMALRPGTGAPCVGKGFKGCGPLWPSLRWSLPPLSQVSPTRAALLDGSRGNPYTAWFQDTAGQLSTRDPEH